MISAWVRATASWTPGQEGAEIPPCKIVDSRLRRGTSLATRMAVDCAERAAGRAEFDLSKMGAVFGSAYGEIDIAIEQLDMMLSGDGIVSPALFKNSVHNTPAGIFSIAAKNMNYSSAVAAGDHTVAATLLEAMIALGSGLVSEVVAAVADEPLREPFRSARPEANYQAFGAAFALAAVPDRALMKLTLIPTSEGQPWTPPENFRRNPCAPAIRLCELISEKRPGMLLMTEPSLSEAPAQEWSVRLERVEE